MLYVVIQAGVYRHDIVGVWESLFLAKKGAEAAISAERDDYHYMEIVAVEPNVLVKEKIVAKLYRKMKREPSADRRGMVRTSEVERQWWIEGDDLNKDWTRSVS